MSSCHRIIQIKDTIIETVHIVTNTHINPLGTLHGGYALRWLITTASMTAMRVARGPALIAHLDHVFFLNPVRHGMNAVVTSWAEYIGKSSIEITAVLEEENPFTGERRLTTAAHMTYVAVDQSLRPRPVGACILPRSPLEQSLYERALERRKTRKRPSKEEPPPPLVPLAPGLERRTYKLVNPEDALAYNAMHGGKLLYIMDELSAITAMEYVKGPVVTAAVDATDFLRPILVGDILEVHAAITYTGNTSLEVTVQAHATNPLQGERRYTATSYFTMVHIDPTTGRPSPIPKIKPTSQWQEKLAEKARERRERRKHLLLYFKQEINKIKPPTESHRFSE